MLFPFLEIHSFSNCSKLVSFSSAEDLSNAVKDMTFFSSHGTESPPFRVFGTRGII